MTDTLTAVDGKKQIFQFIARIENGVIVPQEDVSLPADQIYLVTIQFEPAPDTEADSEVDALAQLAALAQPLGPADLARNFDTYTSRVILKSSLKSSGGS